MSKVLLHVCCGVCAFDSLERLKEEGHSPAVLFFNPNIQPYSEYLRRKKAAKIVAEAAGVSMVGTRYSSSDWHRVCGNLRHEPEGRRRCLLCYELRLRKTFEVCCKKNYDYFTTTLTISPHKVSASIIEIGRRIGGMRFLDFDFKKKDGFKKTIAGAKKLKLYRQSYCGCVCSVEHREQISKIKYQNAK